MNFSNITLTSVLALGMSACIGTANINIQPTRISSIEITAATDANEGEAVAIDLVFAFDRSTLKEIEGFTASGWQSVKNLEVDLGQWDDKAVWKEVEIMPGEVKNINDFPEGYEKAVGLVIFAHYRTPGIHRQVIVNSREVTLRLERFEITSPEGKTYLLTSPPDPASTARQM